MIKLDRKTPAAKTKATKSSKTSTDAKETKANSVTKKASTDTCSKNEYTACGKVGSKCDKYNSIMACNKYCPLRVGGNLARFIHDVPTVESQIGDQIDCGKYSAICYACLDELGSRPATVSSTSVTSVKYRNKFLSVFGKSASALVKSALPFSIYNTDEKADILSKLEAINKNKQLVRFLKPFIMVQYASKIRKPVGSLSVDLDDIFDPVVDADSDSDDAKENTKSTHADKNLSTRLVNARAQSIEYSVTPTGDISQSIELYDYSAGSTSHMTNLSEYGETWWLRDAAKGITGSSNMHHKLIKFNSSNTIQPVSIKGTTNTYILDGKYLYCRKNNSDCSDITIIGEYRPLFVDDLMNDIDDSVFYTHDELEHLKKLKETEAASISARVLAQLNRTKRSYNSIKDPKRKRRSGTADKQAPLLPVRTSDATGKSDLDSIKSLQTHESERSSVGSNGALSAFGGAFVGETQEKIVLLVKYETLAKDKAVKYLLELSEYLSRYNKFICPYLTCSEETEITLPKGY